MEKYQFPYESSRLLNENLFHNPGQQNVRNATEKIKKILKANHNKANLKKTVNNLKYLNNNDKQSLIFKLFRKHEEMFDGTLYTYTGSEYKIELLDGAKQYHAKPFPISKIHKETIKTEVNRSIKICA